MNKFNVLHSSLITGAKPKNIRGIKITPWVERALTSYGIYNKVYARLNHAVLNPSFRKNHKTITNEEFIRIINNAHNVKTLINLFDWSFTNDGHLYWANITRKI